MAVAGLLVLSIYCTAFAEFKIGRFTICPEIGLAEIYRSNIYQTEWNQKSDFITSILPSVRGQYTFGGDHSLSLGYSGDGKYYAHYSENNYWNNTAWGNLSLRFPGGLDFNVDQSYINNWLERSAFIYEQRHYIEYLTGAKMAYRFADRWKAQLQYLRDDYNMSSRQYSIYSYLSNLYGGSIFYRLTARTSALIEYQYITKSYDESNVYDSTVNQVFMGLSLDPAGKLTGQFKFGYGWREFDEDLAGRESKSNTWVADANLVQNFTKYTSLKLSGLRAFRDDGDYDNVPYYMTAAALTFQHLLTGKVGVAAMAGYERADYQEKTPEPITGILKKRTDNVYSTGIGTFYNIQKYLKLRLDYIYINRDSNFEGYSFDENKVMFKIVYSP